jgi:Domain of unknown function (DUF4329)
MNLYGYAAGDPINNSDPFGLCPEKRSLIGWLLQRENPACTTRDEAARRALEVIGPDRRSEWSGEIISDPDGGFRFTKARTLSLPTQSIVYPGRPDYEGAYHNHPGGVPGTLPNEFSRGDKGLADDTKKPIYVLTPSGEIRRYDPDPARRGNGEESTVPNP